MDPDDDSMLDESEQNSVDDQESTSSDNTDDLGIGSDEEEAAGPRSAPSRSVSQDEKWEPEILTPPQIMHFMMEIVGDVSSILGLSTTTSRLLLSYFKWDRQKLLESYYDGNRDRLFEKAHIVRQGSDDRSSNNCDLPSKRAKASKSDVCEICYLDWPDSQKSGLNCGHVFCRLCWSDYLTEKIMNDGMADLIFCPAYKCGIVVDDRTIRDNIAGKHVRLRYQQLLTSSFVQAHRGLAWCPFPDCANAVRVKTAEFKPVVCTCGYWFCFICGQEWHAPINCEYLKRWIRKCNDDSETSNWIVANTKECPKCHVSIEKNGGCNYMHCKRQNCLYGFCWLCMGEWINEGPHSCNSYVESAVVDSKESSRAALTRYLFYYNRYINHIQSRKLEKKLQNSVNARMQEMQEHDVAWIDIQFLLKAVEVLSQCRRTLMYSYGFAFYLVKNNQTMIFEDNQNDLENATEALSGFLERELKWENISDIKPKVLHQYKYCDSRRKVLLDHCQEGLDKDWWEFSSHGNRS